MAVSSDAKTAGGGKAPHQHKKPDYYGKPSNAPAQKTTTPKKNGKIAPGVP